MKKDITICFTYFKSLALINLRAALYSVRQQDFSRVREVIVVDNDTEDAKHEVRAVMDAMLFPCGAQLLSFKHGDRERTHSWSTNMAVQAAQTKWVLFTRADYLLDFNALWRFTAMLDGKPSDWPGFVTANVRHMAQDVGVVEATDWRFTGPTMLREMSGFNNDHTCIDAGVWLARREDFVRAGGLDEGLSAWGHAQTHFQHKLFKLGVECVRIPEVLFYHPLHAAPRDLGLAHRQLQDIGVDIHEMWARYHGASPY